MSVVLLSPGRGQKRNHLNLDIRDSCRFCLSDSWFLQEFSFRFITHEDFWSPIDLKLILLFVKLKAPGQYRQTESVSLRAGVENSTYNSSFNINKISLFEKENTVFTDSKDRQVKHYYPNKKAVTLRIGSGQKEFLRVQRNQQSFF